MRGCRLGRRHAWAALAAGALLALGGCGLGAGEQADAVHLRVSDDFGRRVLAEPSPPKQAGADTVMRLLQRNAKVTTRYGGGFVQSINGLSGLADSGQQVDWFYFVNGIQAGRGAADWRVRAGERIWWDRHRWELDSVSAVVGDFPEPMRNGHDRKWAGALLDCQASDGTCDVATQQLRDAGVTVREGTADQVDSPQTRVLIGPWSAIQRRAPEATQLAGGPAVSGIFAKVGPRGVVPLDSRGRGTRAEPGMGLVAALQTADHSPLWVVTGATEEATRGAVAALSAETLAGRFAVAVRGDRALALPLRAGDEGAEVTR